MSHDDTNTENETNCTPFETDESGYNPAVVGEMGSGKTTKTIELASRVVAYTESVEIVDPKGDGETECPLGNYPAANDTPQSSSEDDTNREGEGGEPQ